MHYFVIGFVVALYVLFRPHYEGYACLQSSKYGKSHHTMWYKEYLGLAKKSKKYAKSNRRKSKRYARKAAKVMDRMTPIVL
jgi:hypothetical protein